MKTFHKKLSAGIMLVSAIGGSTSALAAAAVNTANCYKMAHTTQPFILVLNSNEDLLGSITQCASDAKLLSASISGLGQVQNPTLAYFTSNPADKPTLTTFEGFFELAALSGNITNSAGKYYTHMHVALADKNFHGIAGHVDHAKVGLTVEVTISPFAEAIERAVDAETGFGPIITQ